MKDYSAKINRIKIQLDEIGKKEFEALGTFFSNDPITINCWSEQTNIPATTLHSRILRLIEKNPELSKHVMDVNNIIRVDKIIRNRILETPTDMMSLNDYFATEKMSAQEQRRVIGYLDKIKNQMPEIYEENVRIVNHKRYLNPQLLQSDTINMRITLKISEEQQEHAVALSDIAKDLKVPISEVRERLAWVKQYYREIYHENFYGKYRGEFYVTPQMERELKTGFPTAGFLSMSDAAEEIGLEPMYVIAQIRQIKKEDPNFFYAHTKINFHQCFIDEELLDRVDEKNDEESWAPLHMYNTHELMDFLEIPEDKRKNFSLWLVRCKNKYFELFKTQDRYYRKGRTAYFSLGLMEMIREIWIRGNIPHKNIPDCEPME